MGSMDVADAVVRGWRRMRSDDHRRRQRERCSPRRDETGSIATILEGARVFFRILDEASRAFVPPGTSFVRVVQACRPPLCHRLFYPSQSRCRSLPSIPFLRSPIAFFFLPNRDLFPCDRYDSDVGWPPRCLRPKGRPSVSRGGLLSDLPRFLVGTWSTFVGLHSGHGARVSISIDAIHRDTSHRHRQGGAAGIRVGWRKRRLHRGPTRPWWRWAQHRCSCRCRLRPTS